MKETFRYNLAQLVRTEVTDVVKSERMKYYKFQPPKKLFGFKISDALQAGVYDVTYDGLYDPKFVSTKEELGDVSLGWPTSGYQWIDDEIYAKAKIELLWSDGHTFKRRFNTIKEANEFDRWITNHRKEFVTLSFHGDEWKPPYGNFGQLDLGFGD